SATDGTLVQATIITMRRLLIGYAIGLVGGLPLGLLTARWKVFHDTIGTLALGLQTLPSVCWVPLALLWFGQTEAAMRFVEVIGIMLVIVVIGLLADKILFSPVERFLHRRWGTNP